MPRRHRAPGPLKKLLALMAAVGLTPLLCAQVPAASRLWPNLEDNIARPLRYRPDGPDFVIENGAESFNRPLYGRPTAFRVDAGDRPEFVLYLPGRGGNLRLGLRAGGRAKWLHEADRVVARYRPGTMLYEIGDALLGAAGRVRLEAIALPETDGLVVSVEASGTADGLELVWAYGGVNGERGVRDGDIGTEKVPISEWFQLRPEYCADNRFQVQGGTFTLTSRTATILGLMPAAAQLAVGDARRWASCAETLASAGGSSEAPVMVGRLPLVAGRTEHLALQRIAAGAVAAEELATYRNVTADSPGAARAAPVVELREPYRTEELPEVLAAARAHFARLRGQVAVETPDPFLNAAVAALNVAADAVWDEPQGVVMHGAIAWRSRLLGWRGPYAMDALGWHDRARRHFAYWATRQNTAPIPPRLPPPDADTHLARSEAGLHSNGDLSNSHYDMNLVYIDALFRHLRWTGDRELAREVWPVIERHLAWERRLFRREFGTGPDQLPLYEAYAAIWASDDLQYHGGGTTHASAYNYWHNRMAARVARWLGHDAAPYEREADQIAAGLRAHLWTGTHFAEFKDLLGRRLVHPSAALWSFYHVMDAELPTTAEAVALARHFQGALPFLPVRGPGVPDDAPYGVYASTDWLPYSWSINNVVMGENIHTALGLWQAGRAEEAFRLMKSSLLAAMFMGICPGNVGSMNYLDVYRRESQRDFADGNGVTSRALVEGLFGLRPNLIDGELLAAPGFPAAWDRASIRHPRVSLEYRREGRIAHYRIEPGFGQPVRLRLRLPRAGTEAEVEINGRPVEARWGDGPEPALELIAPPAARFEVRVAWRGTAPRHEEAPRRTPPPHHPAPLPLVDRQEPVELAAHLNDRVTEIFRPGKYVSPRSPYVSLAMPAQGIGAWAGHVNARAEIDDTGLRALAAEGGGRITLPNGISFATPGAAGAANILFTSQWDNYPGEAVVPLAGRARQVHLLMAGSTNHMQSRLDNGEVVVTYADGSADRLALRNPETWWPIEQDYFIDDFQFRVEGPLPVRLDLKSGRIRELDPATFKGQGRVVPGGAATVLTLTLDPAKELRSLTVRALANEVVIGLMAATLAR